MKNYVAQKYRDTPIAAKAAFWFMISSFLQKGILALTTPVFARLMSTDQYGQFTVYMSWTNIFMIIATLKLDDSVFNVGMSKFKEDRDSYVSTMQIITIIISSILMLFFALFQSSISSFIGLPSILVCLMIIETYANSASYFWNRRKRYEYQYKQVLFKILGMTLLNTILGIILVLISVEKGYARIISCISINLLFGILILIYNLMKGKGTFVPQYARFAILFNLPLLGHYLSVYILDQFDRIMIQKMVGFSAAALYGLAYHIGTILTLFTSSLNNALTPWLYGKLEKQEYNIIGKILLYIVCITSVLGICISAIAPEIIVVFGGEKYKEAMYVIPPIALGMVFKLVYMIFASIEFYFEKNKAAMFMSGFAAVLDIILNYFGIIYFGYSAAAYTTLICYMTMYALHYLYTMKCVTPHTKGKPNFKILNINCILIATVVVSISFSFLYPYMIIRLAIVIAIIVFIILFRSKFLEAYSTFKSE